MTVKPNQLLIFKLYAFKLYLLLIAIFITGCSSRQLLDPTDSLSRLKNGGSLQHEVNLLVKPLIKNRDNIGAVVAVLDSKNTVSIFPFGNKNAGENVPMTVNTLFGIGSTTKSLVVSLMLALDAEGIISINDTISEFLPSQMLLKDPHIRDITFAQLASHTSGLPREPLSLDTLASLLGYFFTGNNLYSHLTKETVYDFLANYELKKKKEGSPSYSNIGIGLLAHFLTLKTNRDLESLLSKYIFSPLQMKHTVVQLKNDDIKRLATGYAGDQPLFIPWNTPLDNWKFSSIMLGTGGVYSTAPDLINYLKAHMGKSNTKLDIILQKSHIIVGKDREHYLTMGWYVEYLPKYGLNFYFYHGMIAGFNCYIGFEPTTKTAVVVLRNNFNWHDVVGHNLLLRLSLYNQQK